MDLIELTPDYEVTEFDCGDEQLNKFLFEDAKPSLALRVANTFILVDDGRVAAYFCLLNDKVSKDEIIGSRWKKVRANFQQSKQFRSYPTIKIGRFAVSINYRGKNIGTDLMDSIKAMLHAEHGRSARCLPLCRSLLREEWVSAPDEEGFARPPPSCRFSILLFP